MSAPSRRDLLQIAAPLGLSLAAGRVTAASLDAAVTIDPTPRFALSPYLFMQFMEPLGTTDGSVEASWDHLAARWRPDLVETTRALAPPMLRWGGLFSAYYRWREGVGPRAARRPMHNLMWGGVETNQVGTAEFHDFCTAVGAEPLMCVNFAAEGDASWAINALGEVRAGTAAEAADWVRYCNAPNHPERAAHGRAQPMPIRYWQIGNETSLSKKRFGKAEAIARTVEFARAMRAADPSIKLIAWGDSGWAADMIAGTRGLVDMVAFHNLFDPGPACGDTVFRHDPAAAWATLMAAAARQEAKIAGVRAESGAFPLALTESHFQIGGRNRGDINSTWAVGVAFARMQNVHQRHGDVLRIANLGDFCGTRWQTNVVMLPTPRGQAYLMPVGRVAQLYRRHIGSHAVGLSGVPAALDAVASRRDDTLFVHVVNTSMTEAVACRWTIGRKAPAGGKSFRIAAADPFAEIVGAKEDPMMLTAAEIDPRAPVVFPPASVTALELKL